MGKKKEKESKDQLPLILSKLWKQAIELYHSFVGKLVDAK